MSFTTLESCGKWENLMGKLQIWVIDMVNISATSFKNLTDKLSIPATLFMRNFLEDLRCIWFELFEKLIFQDVS